MSSGSEKLSPQVLEMADNVGAFIEYWGFKQVHGKVWTLLFLAPGPVDANYLIDNLKISKALVSMTIKDLLFYNVIEEVEKEKPGTQRYQFNPDITSVILDVIQKREVKMLKELQKSFKNLNQSESKKENSCINQKHLADLGQMIDSAHLLLEGMTAGGMVDFQQFEQATSISES